MLETLDYMFCIVIYSYKILGKIKDLGSLARGILHIMRGTCVNLTEKEVRTCTRVLLYISDDDDVDAKILFTEMIKFIIVTYEQFNREKIMTKLEIQNALRILTKAVKFRSKLEFVGGDIIVLTVDDKETIARTQDIAEKILEISYE